MPRFQIEDSASGRTMVVEGDAPPTEQDAEELFASYKPEPTRKANASASVAPFSPEDKSFRDAMGNGSQPLARDAMDRAAQDFEGRIEAGKSIRAEFPEQDVLREWNPSLWEKFRTGTVGRKLFGPTESEQAAIQSGAIAGAPGGDPGLVPLIMATPAPFLPGAESKAGKVLLSYFVAKNLESQPQRVASIKDAFERGDTRSAYQEILQDLIDTGMAGAAAHGLYEAHAPAARRIGNAMLEQVSSGDLGNIEPQARAGGAPEIIRQPTSRGSETYAPNVEVEPPNIGIEKAANYSLRPTPRERVTVPETPAELRETAVQEIQRNGATTIREIQALFPKAKINREKARELRDAAWPEFARKEVQGPPKPWEDFAPAEATEAPGAKTENVPEAAEVPKPDAPAPEINAGPSAAPEQSAATEIPETKAPAANVQKGAEMPVVADENPAAEHQHESGARWRYRKTRSGRTAKEWTQTAFGLRVGDKYDEGMAVDVIAARNDSTPEMPRDFVVSEVNEILGPNEIELRIRDMTPDEIAAQRARLEKENEMLRELGMPEIEIPSVPKPAEIPETKAPAANVQKGTEMPVVAGENPAPETFVNAPASRARIPEDRIQTLAHERVTKGNVTPLVDFRVGQDAQGQWHYTLQLNSSDTGYGTPMIGPFPSKEIAVNQGLMDASQWLARESDSRRVEGNKAHAKNLLRIKAALKPLLDKQTQRQPAPWEKPAETKVEPVPPKTEQAKPAEPKTGLTPMMEQYQRIKKELPKDALLAFRLGDFYEFFFEDAGIAGKALNTAVTKRGSVDMAGIPAHAAEKYFAQLTRAGHRVAVVDAAGEVKPGELVKREVVATHEPAKPVETAAADSPEKYLKVQVPDPGEATQVAAGLQASHDALGAKMNELEAKIKFLAKLVEYQTGPRYQRGQIKPSAPKKALQEYRALKAAWSDTGRARNAIEEQARKIRGPIAQARLAEKINDPSRSLISRMMFRKELYFEQKETPPDSFLQALRTESDRIAREHYPDATEWEVRAMETAIQRSAYDPSGVANSFQLDPRLNLPAERRAELIKVFNANTSDAVTLEFSPELQAELKKQGLYQANTREATMPKLTRIQTDELIARVETEAKQIRAARERESATAAGALQKLEREMTTVIETGVVKSGKAAKEKLLGALREALEKAPEEAAGKATVTIQIPGDGTFKMPNTKAQVQAVLDRAEKIDTRSTLPMKIPHIRARVTQAEAGTRAAQEAIEVYGNAGAAYLKLRDQLARAKELELSPEQIDRLASLVERLKNTIEAPAQEKRRLLNDAESRLELYEKQFGPKSKQVKEAQLRVKQLEKELAEEEAKRLIALGQKPPATAAEGGRVSARAAAKQAPEETPATANPKKVSALRSDIKRLQANTAPQTIDEPARYVGNVLRELNAQFANEMVRADEALKPFRADFDRTPVPKDWVYAEGAPLPRNYAFVDAYEGGKASDLGPMEAKAVETFKEQNADWIERIHALGTGALKTFYEDYFPHIWDDPARAKQIIGALLVRRPLEGPKSFLKQRTHQLFVEALKAGLRPVHDNPVDLWLLKKREVERYILARRLINETKAEGVLKFVHSFSRPPAGHTLVNDPAFTVWGKPSIPVTEAFDGNQRRALIDLLKYLRIPMSRLAALKEDAWGLAYGPPLAEIQLKVGSTEATAWHELGHQIDWAFPELRERLKMRGNSPMAKQLRALADLRAEGQESVSPSYRSYLRKTEEKMAEIFKAYIHAPELFQEAAPDVWRVVNKWLDENPVIRQKLDAIKPRLTYGTETTEIPLNGMLKLGSYYLPDAAARVVNNFLSPGLNPHLWYRSLRETSNLLNGVQLGLSAFHLGFTSLDAATSRLSVAIEDAWHGDFARAFKTAASVPVSPITNIMKGAKLRAEVLKPGSQSAEIQQITQALQAGGGRVGQDPFWRTNFTRRMMRAIRAGTASGYISGALQAPFALFEQTVRPIMEYVVPRQKLGVFADMAQREIERLGPDADPVEVREAMRKVWDSVDNRMGQLVYDNLFYNRWIKDVALLSFRAYGWQLGKYREGFGALIDSGRGIKTLASGKKPELSHRMAYAMALPLMVGTLGAIAHYLMTGRRPEGQDYFMPQTGELDNKGNPVRLNFPSYLKDVMAYSQHPVTSFGHSLNPLGSSIFDLLENQDFYDVEIRHPDDPLWQQGSDVALFAAKQFVPFSVSGALKMREDAAPLHKQVLPFFGITPAPSRMTMTPAQELAAELMADAMPSGARTREQFDRSKLIKEIVRGIKTGDSKKIGLFSEAIASGKLQPDATAALMDRLKYTPFQFQVFHLNADAAMRVWRIASPAERAELNQIMAQKVIGAKSLTPEKKKKYVEELQAGN